MPLSEVSRSLNNLLGSSRLNRNNISYNCLAMSMLSRKKMIFVNSEERVVNVSFVEKLMPSKNNLSMFKTID